MFFLSVYFSMNCFVFSPETEQSGTTGGNKYRELYWVFHGQQDNQ